MEQLDLNLLRLFETIYRLRNVSRAAEALGMSQPAASQGLTRLRLALGDALFVRAPGEMRPTPRAHRLAGIVQEALMSIEGALNESVSFDPAAARTTLQLHMSDIGEARLLPSLITALRKVAPGIKLQTVPLPHDEIADALDAGKIDFAFGFLPNIGRTQFAPLFQDKYSVVVRSDHPLADRFHKLKGKAAIDALSKLEYVAVRSHAATQRILHELGLEDRLMLSSAHFLSLPEIVMETDLGVIMPRAIAKRFARADRYTTLDVDLPQSHFTVSMYWSKRFEADPVHKWLRGFITEIFTGEKFSATHPAPTGREGSGIRTPPVV